VAALGGDPAGSSKVGKDDRSPASANASAANSNGKQGSNALGSGDGTSIFAMIRSRYKSLCGIGRI
jgi:hypothetical protein